MGNIAVITRIMSVPFLLLRKNYKVCIVCFTIFSSFMYSDLSPSFDKFLILQVTTLAAVYLAHLYLAGYSWSLVLVVQARHLLMVRKRKELKL